MEEPEPDIWRDLAVLLAVGEAQSSSAAAQALGLSPVTIASRLNTLEARVGSVLVKRLDTGWQLTAAGQNLAQQARSIADLVERTGRHALGGSAARLTMSCPEFFFEHLLLPVWYRIQQKIPAQSIRLRSAANFLDTTTDGNDLTLCMSPPAELLPQGVEIGSMTFRLYAHRRLLGGELSAAPSYFAVDGPELALPDLIWPELGQTRRVTCPNLAVVAAGVKAAQGIGLVPDFIAQHDTSLVPISAVPSFSFKLWALCTPRNGVEQHARVLTDLLTREIAALLVRPNTVRH